MRKHRCFSAPSLSHFNGTALWHESHDTTGESTGAGLTALGAVRGGTGVIPQLPNCGLLLSIPYVLYKTWVCMYIKYNYVFKKFCTNWGRISTQCVNPQYYKNNCIVDFFLFLTTKYHSEEKHVTFSNINITSNSPQFQLRSSRSRRNMGIKYSLCHSGIM